MEYVDEISCCSWKMMAIGKGRCLWKSFPGDLIHTHRYRSCRSNKDCWQRDPTKAVGRHELYFSDTATLFCYFEGSEYGSEDKPDVEEHVSETQDPCFSDCWH